MSTPHEEHDAAHHPTFQQYVVVAIILFTVTIVEFLLIYDKVGIDDHLGASRIPLLVILSVFKFAVVIMFYMHLKFDAPLFSGVFLSGVILAFIVGIAVVGLYFGFEGKPRGFAEAHAIPFVEHESEAETEPVKESAPPPVATAVPTISATASTVAATAVPVATDVPVGTAPTGGDPAAGQAVFSNTGCTACHTIVGVEGAVGQIGPELTNVATNASTRGGMSAEQYIRESIENPSAFVVDGFSPLMPPLRSSMSDEEFENLVAFLLTRE